MHGQLAWKLPPVSIESWQATSMPSLSEVKILRAWRQRNEIGRIDRIHYMISRAEGEPRRCYVDAGAALHQVLDEHLRAIGYAGPKDDEEH